MHIFLLQLLKLEYLQLPTCQPCGIPAKFVLFSEYEIYWSGTHSLFSNSCGVGLSLCGCLSFYWTFLLQLAVKRTLEQVYFCGFAFSFVFWFTCLIFVMFNFPMKSISRLFPNIFFFLACFFQIFWLTFVEWSGILVKDAASMGCFRFAEQEKHRAILLLSLLRDDNAIYRQIKALRSGETSWGQPCAVQYCNCKHSGIQRAMYVCWMWSNDATKAGFSWCEAARLIVADRGPNFWRIFSFCAFERQCPKQNTFPT